MTVPVVDHLDVTEAALPYLTVPPRDGFIFYEPVYINTTRAPLHVMLVVTYNYIFYRDDTGVFHAPEFSVCGCDTATPYRHDAYQHFYALGNGMPGFDLPESRVCLYGWAWVYLEEREWPQRYRKPAMLGEPCLRLVKLDSCNGSVPAMHPNNDRFERLRFACGQPRNLANSAKRRCIGYTPPPHRKPLFPLTAAETPHVATSEEIVSVLRRDFNDSPFRSHLDTVSKVHQILDFDESCVPACAPRLWQRAVTLAKHIDDNRLFGELGIVADALEDADYNNTDVLQHLRTCTTRIGCTVLQQLAGYAANFTK